MIEVEELFLARRAPGPTWADVEPGDGLVYPDGALFIVEARSLDDGLQVTLTTRCVVPPKASEGRLNQAYFLSRKNADPVANAGASLVKGYHELR